MERTQIFFTKRQKKFFKKEAVRLEVSYASLIRRVLDDYIDKYAREKVLSEEEKKLRNNEAAKR
jgi:hypothetical protein